MIMFYIIKSLDIIYVTIIYFILSILLTIFINKLLEKYDSNYNLDKQKPLIIFLKCSILVSFYVLVIYLLRNIVGLIPSPFNNLYGFKHHKIKELSGSLVFSYLFLSFQYNTLHKLEYIVKYISNHDYLSIYKLE